MTPSLDDIELFVEVAKALSFTRASEALDVPAPTISRRVARLEQVIGVRLLNRSTRGMALTRAGSLYFERCRPIVEQARMAHELLDDHVQQLQGRLRVSLPSSLALGALQSSIYEFSRLYPRIECEYDLSVRKIDLQADDFDVVIRAARLPDSNVVAHRLGTFLLGLYASPDYLQDHGTPLHPEDLQAHQCLRVSTTREDSCWQLHSSGEHREIQVSGRMAMNHVLTLRHMAALGAGIVPLPIQDRYLDSALVRVLPNWTLTPIPLVALFPSRMMPARSRAFIDFLGERLDGIDILSN